MENAIKSWLKNKEKGTVKVNFYNNSFVFSYPCQTHDCTYYEAILHPGTYIFETWGAQGGYNGGLGGYSRGVIQFSYARKINIHIGSMGLSAECESKIIDAGFNGGGKALAHSNQQNGCRYAGSGGGATDIRMHGNTLYNRVIVAGGGGGSTQDPGGFYKGGSGGGSNGVSTTNIPSQAANKTSPGIGDNPIGSSECGTNSGEFGNGGYSTRSGSTYGGGG